MARAGAQMSATTSFQLTFPKEMASAYHKLSRTARYLADTHAGSGSSSDSDIDDSEGSLVLRKAHTALRRGSPRATNDEAPPAS